MYSDEDGLRADQRLLLNPVQSIRRAKAGRMFDLRVIADAIGCTPEFQTEEIIEMFCSHLDASKVPRPRPPISPGHQTYCYNASSSLRALAQVTGGSPMALPEPIKRAWPGTFKWIVFFVDMAGRLGVLEPTKLLDAISLIFTKLIFDDATRETMLRTPGFVAFIASIWMREETKVSTSDRPLLFSDTFFRVLFNAPDDSCFEEVVRGAGGNAEDIVKHAISGMLRVLMRQPPSEPDIYTYLSVIGGLIQDPVESRLLSALCNHGVVAVVTCALRILSDLRRLDGIDVRDAVGVCFLIFNKLTRAVDAISNVRDMVKGGLLQALVEISPEFDLEYREESIRNVILALIDRILPFLLFRSVILAVDSAVSSLHPVRPSTMVQCSPIADKWESMILSARQAADLMHTVDSENKLCCYNCLRDAEADGLSLKRCAGCRCDVYCSKECQAIAWKRHKGGCKLRQEALEAVSKVISKKDLTYHENRMAIEARAHAQEVIQMAALNWPDTPLSDVGILLDYTPYYYGQETMSCRPWLLSDTANLPLSADELQDFSRRPILADALNRAQATIVVSHIYLGPEKAIVSVPVADVWRILELERTGSDSSDAQSDRSAETDDEYDESAESGTELA